jgi:hypothetical protein
MQSGSWELSSWQGGWTVNHDPEIAPGELVAERADFGQVVLERRLHDMLLPKLISGKL